MLSFTERDSPTPIHRARFTDSNSPITSHPVNIQSIKHYESSSIQQNFQALTHEGNSWECDFIFNEAITGDTEPINVNLSEYFQKKKKYQFPDHFDGIENLQRLVISLQMASIKCGFLLIKSSSKSGKKFEAQSKFGVYITFSCQSSVAYTKRMRGYNKDAHKRKISTIRPMCKSNCCKFVCYLQMFKENHAEFPGKWILKGSKTNDGSHNGHWQMEPSQLTLSINKMSDEERKLACQCSQISFTASASAALINLRNELDVSYNEAQIRYLNKREQQKVSALTENASSADILVEAFQQRKDVAFLTVCYSPREGLVLSMTNKQKTKLNLDLYLNHASYTEESFGIGLSLAILATQCGHFLICWDV